MSHEILVGGDILRLITAGTYDNPLVIYREYIQNAADAIEALGNGSRTVTIEIDALESRVTITDGGTGLSPTDAVRHLIPIGNSAKSPGTDRGFRGIGRLSSLAFAESVHFTTRTCAAEPVTRVSWDSRTLRDIDSERVDATTAIRACTTVRSLAEGRWPDRFFQVTIDRVTRHAASTLLNKDAVRRYVGEVCPVPMAPSFPLAADVKNFLSTHTEYCTLDVGLNGDDFPVMRPFGETVPLTDSYAATYKWLERRLIPRLDGDEPAAALWLAHTPYAGSIPRRLGVRGLRARAGNIQIGSDDIFSHLFLETRFNGWCIGEVHIVDSRIVPNARRDYFEPGPHLRNLENHIGAIVHEISSRCRGASSHRNKLRNVGVTINQVKCANDLAMSGYLTAEDAAALLAHTRERTPQIRKILDELEVGPSHFGHDGLSLNEHEPESAEPSRPLVLSDMSANTVATLQSAFGVVADVMSPASALDLIESIVRRLSEQQQCD